MKLKAIFASTALLFVLATGGYCFPAPTENYVNDFAGVLSPSLAQKLRDTLQLVEKQTGIEGTVVTINSMAEYEPGIQSIEEFSTGLFNRWGVGNRKKNNGFMILVSIKDRKCRIELGDGYGSQYNMRMKEIIDEDMIPYFKMGSHSHGIYAGTMATIHAFTKKVSWMRYHLFHLLGFGSVLIFIISGIISMRHGRKGWAYLLFGAATALFLGTLRSITWSKGDTTNSSGGFGGGSSSGGGGASGSW